MRRPITLLMLPLCAFPLMALPATAYDRDAAAGLETEEDFTGDIDVAPVGRNRDRGGQDT